MKDKMKDMSVLRQEVKKLCASQRLCVLATQYDGQPYSNLIAFAETAELRNLIFVTSRNTRKYANSVSNRKVAMMIDNRKNRTADFKTALAVTAIGTAEEVSGSERDVLAETYVSKHPHLAEFVNGSDKALMKVTVTDYIIARFDRVQFIHIDD
jgi:nitroimidazol reductase NimA-like FMN-containing flavoprotein (pyridoxamine 5'-phosphate oxidase superfamily)